jgi:hypothetical protein
MTSNFSADVEIRLHNVVSSDISTRPIAAARQPPRFCCLVIIAAEPGNALVACSSTSRQLMLSRALVLAPLTVYSRMLGRPRGMACYCAAHPPTRAQRFPHNSTLPREVALYLCKLRCLAGNLCKAAEKLSKGPQSGVNECSVRVTQRTSFCTFKPKTAGRTGTDISADYS